MQRERPTNPRPPSALPVEPWLKRFQSPRQLGVGGMGVVWRAFDLRLQRWVAIKGVREASGGSQDRLVREARLLARLQHPSLVQVYDLIWGPCPGSPGSRDRSWWLVMELVEGETLTKRVRSGPPLGIEEVIELGISLAGGLAEAHAYGLVHRDLSSGNVILPARGSAKILDFGLATPVTNGSPDAEDSGHSQDADSILGTPGFVAPERLEGVPSDRRSDLYGLGAVLYFALTGQRRQDSREEAESVSRCVIGFGKESTRPEVLKFRPGCPHSLAACIEKLLSRDPADRVQSAESLVQTLETLELTSPPARSAEVSLPADRSSGTGRWALGTVLLVGIGIGALLTWYLAWL